PAGVKVFSKNSSFVLKENKLTKINNTQTAVVEGFCKAHKIDEAKKAFRKMKNNGVSPNAFSYGVLIRGLCIGRSLVDAFECSVEMLKAGHSPNVVTFTTLVDGFLQGEWGYRSREHY
ncbi:Pentatricopeptide repeat (PPR) superfamily protein, partial [Thalictrum thalictroides]